MVNSQLAAESVQAGLVAEDSPPTPPSDVAHYRECWVPVAPVDKVPTAALVQHSVERAVLAELVQFAILTPKLPT